MRKRDLLAVQPHLAFVGVVGAGERLDQRRLAGTVVTDDAEHLAREQVEIGAGERGDATEALDQAARGENGLRCGRRRSVGQLLETHADTLLIHWSIADGDDDEDADGEVRHSGSTPA